MVLGRKRLCPEPERPCTFALDEAAQRGDPEDIRPCKHCRRPDLERSLDTPMGEVLGQAIEWQNDIELGMPPRPSEITVEEYEALLALRWAQNKREDEAAEEKQQAAEMAARARRG